MLHYYNNLPIRVSRCPYVSILSWVSSPLPYPPVPVLVTYTKSCPTEIRLRYSPPSQSLLFETFSLTKDHVSTVSNRDKSYRPNSKTHFPPLRVPHVPVTWYSSLHHYDRWIRRTRNRVPGTPL